MIQALLTLIQLAAVVCFSIATLVFLIIAIFKRKKKKPLYIFLSLALVSILFSVLIWNVDLYAAETTDRSDCISAFTGNFGFAPPESIKEIKLKNYVVYDAEGYFMCFTYDSTVFNKILSHDQPLDTAVRSSYKFDQAIESTKKHANTPAWFVCPDSNIEKIYFKENFMDHTYSEYNIWVNKKTNMVYLDVSYFD
jgi:hypothetical protein